MSERLALLAFVLLLAVTALCYRPALSGEFQLDDVGNLGELARIDDGRAALDFILAGEAGPLGRPVALASFAAQSQQWQHGPAAFLKINILIHLCNAMLLAFCLYCLARGFGKRRQEALLAGLLGAGAWMLLPLLATSTLLVVQRMTTLASLFMLLGLAGYLWARRDIDRRPMRALLLMSVSLVLGTVFAMLSKEIGVLLPVMVLVIESTLLRPPAGLAARVWRSWGAVFLLLPLLAILVYLAGAADYSASLVARKDFTAFERLLTQARVLWIYLAKAILATPSQLGVYLPAPALSRSLFEPLTALASLAWLAAIGSALAWRRRFPLPAFAVLWFVAGHLVESTVVPLELYFEHRNYLPVAGPVFAVCVAVLSGGTLLRRAGLVAIAGWSLFNAGSLYVFAAMAGEPSMTSRHWALHYPDSVRAVSNMAGYQLSEEGPLRALRTLDEFVLRQPQHAYLRIQELNILCRVAPQGDHVLVLQQLRAALGQVDFTYTAGRMLAQLFDTVIAGDCASAGVATVREIAESLRQNPRYRGDRGYQQFHFKMLAGVARRLGDNAAAIAHLRTAMQERRSSELNMMLVTALADAGDFDAARQFIEDARQAPPGNILKAAAWQRDLASLRRYVDALDGGAAAVPDDGR